jgi:hypothetical protein
MCDRVYAPNIHLFAFHLYESEDPNYLWEYYQNAIAPKFHLDQQNLNLIPHNQEDLRHKVELWKGATNENILLPLQGKIFAETEQLITGCAYPALLYDSYALGLNLRIPEYNNENQLNSPVPLDIFQKFNPDSCFLPQNLKPNIGHTILLTAWLTPELSEQKGKWGMIAQTILEKFLGNTETCPRLYRNDYLFNSPCFEYGSPEYATPDGDIRHYLVWLFIPEITSSLQSEADQHLNKCYTELVDLFFYRHKITTAYKYSRQYVKDVKDNYNNLKDILEEISPSLSETTKTKLLTDEDLEKLKSNLRKLAKLDLDYHENVRKINNNQLTIGINNDNYLKKIKQIQIKSYNQYIPILEDFAKENIIKFEKQIVDDIGYFRSGLNLVDTAIFTIRALVEIDQAESDRLRQEKEKELQDQNQKNEKDLQDQIQAIGVGIATGAIIASTVALIFQEPWTYPWQKQHGNYPHPFIIGVAVSIFCTVLVWLATKRLLQWSRQRQSSN